MTASNWQSFLRAQGAVIQGDTVAHYGDAQAELVATAQQDILCDLSHLTLLEIAGADAVNFLQGQLTNDVQLLTGNQAQLSGYCNAKGRLLALFLAFAHQDHLHLQCHGSLAAAVVKRLKMFVLRAKVDIKISDDIIKFGVSGANAAATLEALFGEVPAEPQALITLEKVTILRLLSADGRPRFEIFTNIIHAEAIWNSLKPHFQCVGQAGWDWLEIQAGIPEVSMQTQEQFVPQMLNLDLLDAISFKKGCYTGQEIVARTHYLGSIKRRTFLAAIANATPPAAGDQLLDAEKNVVGQLVRVSPNLQNGFDVLAELRLEAKAAGAVYWQDAALSFKPLPYAGI